MAAWTLTVFGSVGWVLGADTGSSVVVIYNSAMPESKEVAEYYAQEREVPAEQVLGYDLPSSEEMTREDYLKRLETPLLKDLKSAGLFTLEDGTEEGVPQRLTGATIKYAALCYGVPTKVLEDPKLVEREASSLQPVLQRSEASVDSQLAALPLGLLKSIDWTGPVDNPIYRSTNSAMFHPTNGVLLVSRLDGPTPAIARGLVDKAKEAERNGLWGRAYIDSRGLTNGPFLLGDEWLRGAFRVSRIDFPADLDQQEATFTKGYPLSQVAIYAGWYDMTVSGPFSLAEVDFMPGAFAYHLHSFTARTLRKPNDYWVGPLLDRGAAATIGYVYEPFLTFSIDLPLFLGNWLGQGRTYAEAAWVATRVLSWQSIVLGDPLYAPMARNPQELHEDLKERRPDLLPWSNLRVVTRNLAVGSSPKEMLRYLETNAPFRNSPVLLEAMGDLYWLDKRFVNGLSYYEDALQQNPTDSHRLRLLIKLANQRAYFGPAKAALEKYQIILDEYPDYPERDVLYTRMIAIAKENGESELAKQYEQKLGELTAN